ncbi:GNAT family N-acetyltransferase [Oculatella sp. FACHB-28]|uniref:GNAT family N-acetyltransferase n=1 Tax=Oculatella sp. FACHB-28 TaxID=2692845 RepID=UPI0016842B90|nr:GNAT family N-acetyltransferase [Oculatella sp. FACHB-28]MBD2058179.1 GNAT family N-acetyltransferase [Oculatella sp. FACHB-28]
MYEVQRVLDLPVQELAEMLAESKTAGFRAIDRLINEWRAGVNRFDRPGEALFLAKQGNHIIGICGLNHDPYANSTRIGRIRRLYVMQSDRRQGVGRSLVHHVIQAALSFDWLHVRTTSPIAGQFYQSLGFTTCDSEFVTHVLNLTTVHLKNLREELPSVVQDTVP